MNTEKVSSYPEAGPPPPSEITHRGLRGVTKWIRSCLADADPRLAFPGDAPQRLAVTDPGVYVSHPIDPEKRQSLRMVYETTETDLLRVEQLTFPNPERLFADILNGLTYPNPAPLTPWGEAVRERMLHDIKWRARLLRGLSDKQPINATRLSLQNRILNEACGQGQHPFQRDEDYRGFLDQLQQVPAAFRLIQERLAAGVAVEDTMPLRAAEEMEGQLNRLLEKSQDPSTIACNFYPPGLGSVRSKDDLRQRYTETVLNEVLPAYAELHSFLREEYLPYCNVSPARNPFHGERCELLAQYHTDDESMTPARIGEMAREWGDEAEALLREIRKEFPQALRAMISHPSSG